MKPGDLVKVCQSLDFKGDKLGLIGTIIEPWEHQPEWWLILTRDEELIHWPESQLEVISESR